MLSHRPGQGLLEMVIAIGVITVSTLATTTLIVTTIKTGQVSQTRVEAANLAREGVEIVRGIRDSNWLKADQNVIDGSGAADTTVAWNDSGSTDGFNALSGMYIASFSSVTSRWTLQTPCASCATNIQLVTTAAGLPLYFTQGVSSCPSTTCQLTKYSRVITVTPSTSPTDEVDFQPGSPPGNNLRVEYLSVNSTVSATGIKDIVAAERLYNWK